MLKDYEGRRRMKNIDYLFSSVAGVGCTTVEDVLSEPGAMRAIQAGTNVANKEAVSRAQVI